MGLQHPVQDVHWIRVNMDTGYWRCAQCQLWGTGLDDPLPGTSSGTLATPQTYSEVLLVESILEDSPSDIAIGTCAKAMTVVATDRGTNTAKATRFWCRSKHCDTCRLMWFREQMVYVDRILKAQQVRFQTLDCEMNAQKQRFRREGVTLWMRLPQPDGPDVLIVGVPGTVGRPAPITEVEAAAEVIIESMTCTRRVGTSQALRERPPKVETSGEEQRVILRKMDVVVEAAEEVGATMIEADDGISFLFPDDDARRRWEVILGMAPMVDMKSGAPPRLPRLLAAAA